MKNVLYLVLVALCLSLILGEEKAGYCGAGFLSPNLPNDSMIDWFNGQARFIDKESFGLVYSGKEITIDQSSVKIATILKYRFNHEFLFILIESSGGNTYVLSTNSQSSKLQVLPHDYRKGGSSYSEWINVKPSDCFFGRWDFLRVFFLLAISVVIFVLIGSKKNKKLGSE